MSAQLRPLTIGLLLAALFVTSFASAQWQNVGLPIQDFRPGYSKVAIDPNGMPYVAYGVGGYQPPIIVHRFDGSNWQRLPDMGLQSGGTFDFAIDLNGTPYILTDTYSTQNGPDNLVVKKYDGTDWVFVGSSVIHSGAILSDYRLAIDTAGRPFVAFVDKHVGTVRVLTHNGTSWLPVGSLAVKGTIGGLIFDRSGALYLAYNDFNNNNRAAVIKYTGTAWGASDMGGLDSFKNQLMWFFISPQGTHYAILKGFYPRTPITVMKYDGTAWIALNGTFSTDNDFSGLVFDASGTPYIFLNNSYAHTAALMKYNGTAWVATDPRGFPVSRVCSPIISDTAGNFYISTLGPTIDSVWVMKYIPSPGNTMTAAGLVKKAGVIIAPVPATHSISIHSSNESFIGAQAFITDIQGREIYRFVLATKFNIDVRAWPAGVYCLRLPDGSVRKMIRQ